MIFRPTEKGRYEKGVLVRAAGPTAPGQRHLAFERDELALVGGLAAVGLGLFVYFRSQTTPHCPAGYVLQAGQCVVKPPAPPPTPTPTPTPTPRHQSLRTWLIDVQATGRTDVLSALFQAAYRNVLGQYLREQWPDFWNRADIATAVAAGRYDDAEGEWLREQAPDFWNRADIQAAWFGSPPRHSDVFGEYIREQAAGLAISIA